MSRTKRKTSDAVKILDRMMGKDAKLAAGLAAARINAEVAQLIFDARTKERMTQKQLAERVGTTQSVIARLEDADYHGHSLSMLQRIARALDRTLRIEFTRNIAA